MFKRHAALIVFISLFSIITNAQQIGTGQWRIHLPFKNTLGIAETPRYVYTWASYGFYRYDKETGGSERLSKVQGFSDIAVSTIKYNSANDVLLIAYQDANLDLVHDGKIINVTDIQRAQVSGSKNVTNIMFGDNVAYLACTFGIVELDLTEVEDPEIRASYKDLNIGDILDVAVWNNKMYAATDNGIYNAPMVGLNLSDPSSWTKFDTGYTKFLQLFENKLFSVGKTHVKYYDGSVWTGLTGPAMYYNIHSSGGKLYLSRKDSLLTIESNLSISAKFINIMKHALVANDGSIWYTTDNAGTIQLRPDGNLTFTQPNGPYNLPIGKMTSIGDEVIVAGGLIGGNYTFSFSLNGYYRYVNDQWINSLDYPNPQTDSLRDFFAVTTDPNTKDVWLGAYWQGLVRLRNGVVQEVYNPTNSRLKFNIINFLAGLAIDNEGHLWMSNYGTDSALVVRTNEGQWAAMPLGSVSFISQIVVDDRNRKWIVAPRNNGFGMVVYDDNKTPLNRNDDLGPKLLNTNEGSGALPDNQVNCIAKDRDGEIWVGTLKGLVVFSNPSNIFSDKPSDARRIVTGEGTSAGYLLGAEVINCIYVDGGNRKWVGTNNGAWLIAADGQSIIHNFNVDNSPLFSNNVLEITVNEKTGEVFFATDRGIISYKGDATVAKEVHEDVLVFPNPVREDFDGPISIRGLAQDATVKITDIAGNLIYETVANGGMATWNGRSFDGRKASTGVYLVFSGTDDASDTNVAKILVINGGK